MAKKENKDFKETKEAIEIIESPEALQQELSKVTGALEKNKSTWLGIGGGIIAVLILFFGYKYYQNSQDEEGEKSLYKAVYAFENDSLANAAKQLERISNDFGGNTQNLSDLYLGITLIKQGKYDQAIEKLKNFSSSDLLVQARAYALIGDAYTEKKALSEAISYYQKAADYKPNKYFTPMYLLKLGVALEANKQSQEAMETFAKISKDFPQSAEAIPAKKYKAQLEAAISE